MKTAFTSLLLFAFSACATSTKVTPLADLPYAANQQTGIALPIQLTAEESFLIESGCVLSLFRNGELKSYDVSLNAGADVLISELQPGFYSYKDLTCGTKHWSLVHNDYPNFQVQAGKISVLGGLSFYVTASGKLKGRLANREHNRDDTLKLIGRLPATHRENLISAYTGTSLPPSAVEKPARWRNWEITDGDGKKVAKDKRDWPSFRACYRGEADVNSLWLGNLKLEAVFEKKSVVDVKVTDGWHTFTDHFTDCVKSTLRDFHPRAAGRLYYRLSI